MDGSVCAAAALTWRCRRRRSSSVARTRGACHATRSHGTWSLQALAARNAACDPQRHAARDDRIAPSGSSAPLAAQAHGCGCSGGGSGRDGRAIQRRRFAAARRERLRAWCVACAPHCAATGGGVLRHGCPRGSLETARPSAAAAGSATHATGRGAFPRARALNSHAHCCRLGAGSDRRASCTHAAPGPAA
jgi:hypothetical protein